MSVSECANAAVTTGGEIPTCFARDSPTRRNQRHSSAHALISSAVVAVKGILVHDSGEKEFRVLKFRHQRATQFSLRQADFPPLRDLEEKPAEYETAEGPKRRDNLVPVDCAEH